ncbi:DNAH8 [Cordylochernes scorpioides]|uniref:DNAH8 n=1 Tax=Cordylochernes scorpioides TaxID=51811 RepID=A0ABY6LPG4_9ARAC|nr:DNAH8 [Cordylochernes scorpioides]
MVELSELSYYRYCRITKMGALNSMNIFLRQEIDRMQRVIVTVRITLNDLKLAIDGTIIMNEILRDALDCIFDARVPKFWLKISWDSATIGFWFTELLERNDQFFRWVFTGRPDQFWMTGFFNPQGFLTAMRQEVSRAHTGWALDQVTLHNDVTKFYREEIAQPPPEGVYVYGLYLDGAAFDRKNLVLIESFPKALFAILPVVHVYAINSTAPKDPALYMCPVYKKPRRTDLTYITPLWIKTFVNPKHWILRGSISSKVGFKMAFASCANSWCQTTGEENEYYFLWNVKISTMQLFNMREALESSSFITGHDNQQEWKLKLSFLKEEYSECALNLKTALIRSDQDETLAKIEIGLLNTKGKEKQLGVLVQRFVVGLDVTWEPFAVTDNLLNQYIGLNGCLTIFFRVHMAEKISNICGKPEPISIQVSESRLSDDLSQLLESHRFSDVVLYAGDKKFHAHKAILAARSQVFDAMFSHKMKESLKNKVHIEDVDPDVLWGMLQFIYSGKISQMAQIAGGLLVAADKYGLERLKELCEETMVANLTVENAAETLYYADQHCAEQLKTCAIKFINNHSSQVMETEGWNTKLLQQPQLISEVYKALTNQDTPYFCLHKAPPTPPPQPRPQRFNFFKNIKTSNFTRRITLPLRFRLHRF